MHFVFVICRKIQQQKTFIHEACPTKGRIKEVHKLKKCVNLIFFAFLSLSLSLLISHFMLSFFQSKFLFISLNLIRRWYLFVWSCEKFLAGAPTIKGCFCLVRFFLQNFLEEGPLFTSLLSETTDQVREVFMCFCLSLCLSLNSICYIYNFVFYFAPNMAVISACLWLEKEMKQITWTSKRRQKIYSNSYYVIKILLPWSLTAQKKIRAPDCG